MINKHTITCQLDISVYQILDFDEDGYPVTTDISAIVDEKLNQEVTDNEFESIHNAFLMRDSEYSSVNIPDVPECEWLYYKIVNETWMMVVNQYKSLGLKCTIKNPHRYKIELPNNRFIAPSVIINSLEPEELKLDFDKIPEKTQFSELPDGNLELVRVGRDFSESTTSFVDKLDLWRKPVVHSDFNIPDYSLPLDKVERIGVEAFVGYNGSLHIDLPNCTQVGEFAFNRCLGLQSVNLPKVEIIEDFAFNDCHFLTDVNYPEHIIRIGEDAFYGCMNLKHFTKQIGNDTEKITTLPESIVSVKPDAFAYSPMDHLSNNPIYDPSITDDEDWNEEL